MKSSTILLCERAKAAATRLRGIDDGRINAALTPNLLKVTKNPTSLVGNYTKRRIPTNPQGNA
jgi:hypothetical protein